MKWNTPLLDSFLKEVARLHPLQSALAGSLDRKVLSPFTFTDGTHVPAQNYIRVPQQALMLDPKYDPNPAEFDGFRFVQVRDNLAPESYTRLSHPSYIFPFWGSVAHACPGRFYATMMVKMMVAHVLMNYDMKLVDEKASPTFSWGTNVVPNPWMRILIKPKKRVV
ncbi:putative cytochrome P450 [Sclerotinia borealis F-4128]|uniref:Putative cytochrome P450 n=1 Tax=Sclerotinia borealis (strain F-4128) TaxID=1432307 RepID=W9BZW6_SCLBF|nr:putative cytochrome P450 [Sclerotinia borealis F-4128]